MPKIHLIGIGGAGLSAIATVLLQQGNQISGSDAQASANTARLEKLGATVFIGQRPENIGDHLAAVIVSSAISADNPELQAARQQGLKIFKRADWLGQMMAGYTGIAVAGTHGKTTTTAMIAYLLRQAGQDPTFIVGGFVPQMGTNAAAGTGPAFVIEADEYDHMFLGLRPQVTVVTVVEWDHPDIFPTPGHLQQAFEAFVQLVPNTGLVVGCGDAPGVPAVLRQAQAGVTTYGFESSNQWRAENLRPNRRGGFRFDISGPGGTTTVSLAVPGRHNVLNSLAALIVGRHQGLDLTQAAEILGEFTGVERRFQIKGEAAGVTVVDDYAHHPTEIRATLAAARARFGTRPLWVVFQPHTFSRTRLLLDDFAAAFTQADHIIIVDIFAAREKDEGQISSRDLVNAMQHPDARYIGELPQAAAYLAGQVVGPTVVLTLGAGDGYRVGDMVLHQLRRSR